MTIPASPIKTPLTKRNVTTEIFVHAADTPPTMDIGWKEINQWHTRDNGWAAIGYHVVIRRDGTVEAGRPLDTVGSHVKGHNSNSVGICMVGGKGPFSGIDPSRHYTSEQLVSLLAVLAELKDKYPQAEIKGHRDADSGKQCPSFDVKGWLRASGSKLVD